MSSKPTYLGTLCAIALGAQRGEQILSAWRSATADSRLANVLEFVAIREQAHAATFHKRIYELGFRIPHAPSERFADHLNLAAQADDDERKFREILGFTRDLPSQPQTAGPELFGDTSIDPETGALLGRYIAEDRDSHRRLQAEFARLVTPPDEDDGVLADIAQRLDRLSDTLEELKSLRGQ